MKVIFYTWSLNKGDTELIKRIEDAFKKLVEDSTLPKEDKLVTSETKELASYGEVLHDGGIGIAFGTVRGITDPHGFIEELPSLSCLDNNKDNKKWRAGAFEKLQMIVDSLVNSYEEGCEATLGEAPIEAKVYVKTEDGITIGKKDTDFIIDEATAEYARKIKDLVGGNAYMEKNGIKVEIK